MSHSAENHSIFWAAHGVLSTGPAQQKADLAQQVALDWHAGALDLAGATSPPIPPSLPARPEKPLLQPPGRMPKRRPGTPAGRITLLHAIAHIEINAIDLAFDMICRFGPHIPAAMQKDFINDWTKVGADEGRHFSMLRTRLQEYEADYGTLNAHAGLWDAALATQDHVLARLAIAPLVLEARGLDVTPGMIETLTRVGDLPSANLLSIIYEDEITHVAIGARWFHRLCQNEGRDPNVCFTHYVKTRFTGGLKRPFNHSARKKAGLEENFYIHLAD